MLRCSLDHIRLSITNAEIFVAELDQLRDAPAQPVTIETAAEQRRLGRLLRIPPAEFQHNLACGKADPDGFSRNPRDGEGGDGRTAGLGPLSRPVPAAGAEPITCRRPGTAP